MPAFLDRNERRNAATIEVAERLETPALARMQCKTCKHFEIKYFANALGAVDIVLCFITFANDVPGLVRAASGTQREAGPLGGKA